MITEELQKSEKDIVRPKDATLSITEFREKITTFQEKMRSMPQAMEGRELDQYCPLKHSYGDGIYVREIFMPKGTLIMSKIHKFTHPYFVLTGKASILTEDGIQFIEAPFQGMTKAGTKRLLYIYEDMIWITVHVTNKTDLKDIEEEIIAKNFNAMDDFINKNIIEAEVMKGDE